MKYLVPILLLLLVVAGCWKKKSFDAKEWSESHSDSLGIEEKEILTSIPQIDAVLDSVSRVISDIPLKEFTVRLDSFYLPVQNSGDTPDSLPAAVEVEQRILTPDDSENAPIVIRTIYYVLTGRDAQWGHQMLKIELISKGRSIYGEQFPLEYPVNRYGYDWEQSYSFTAKRFQGNTIIEKVDILAPSMASNDGYSYYLYSDTGSLLPFTEPQEIIMRDVHFDADSVYTLFSFGCMTCRIPLAVDLRTRSFSIVAPESTMFPVISYRPDEVSDVYSSDLKVSFYDQPNIGARHQSIFVSIGQHITVSKLSVPRGSSMSSDDVWALVNIAGNTGWIRREAQDRLGLTGCD